MKLKIRKSCPKAVIPAYVKSVKKAQFRRLSQPEIRETRTFSISSTLGELTRETFGELDPGNHKADYDKNYVRLIQSSFVIANNHTLFSFPISSHDRFVVDVGVSTSLFLSLHTTKLQIL